MTQNIRYDSKSDFLLVFLLLFVSGNPAFYRQSWYIEGIVFVSLFLLLMLKKYLTREFLLKYLTYISIFLVIFLIQYFNLGYLSINTVFGFAFRVFIGGIIFYKVGDRFSPLFFNVMYWLCILSFPFYLLHLVEGENALPFTLVDSPRSILFYTFRPQVFESFLRNSGMFWEPGAFQGYINLCLFLNFRRIPYIFKFQKVKLIVILLTLVTTQSTTGYLTFGILCAIYLLMFSHINKLALSFLILIFFFLSFYAYNKLDFLGEKISAQYNEAIQAQGDFDPRRFGALLFDWHYIQKNPLTGNGFSDVTRFADHPFLLQEIRSGENLGLGNGFSNFIASAGILGMLWYLYLIIKNQTKEARKDSIILCVLLIILLQGEPFLNFAFFLGMPFIVLYYRNLTLDENV
ncbi:O-antigen ligase family protein [Arcticibacter tournemirensis]